MKRVRTFLIDAGFIVVEILVLLPLLALFMGLKTYVRGLKSIPEILRDSKR